VDVPLWLWIAVLGVILLMLAIDLFAHRKAHVIGVREAAVWSTIWVTLGVAFGGYIWWEYGAELGQQYYAGYLIEKSLAVDNVFGEHAFGQPDTFVVTASDGAARN